MTCDDVKALAYVRPEALSEADRLALTDHLNVCPPCRVEYEQIRVVGDALLAVAPTQTPSPRVRQMLISRLQTQRTPKTSPKIVSVPPKTSLLQRLSDWLFGSFVTLPRGAVWASAALVVALLAGNVWQQRLLQQQAIILQAEAEQQQRIFALLSDPQAQQVGLKGVGDAASSVANLRYDPTTNLAVLLIRDLPTLPPDKNYQLWLIYGDDARDTGAVFACDPGGSKVRTLLINAPRQFNTYIRFGVTIEPAGGSPRPTGPRAFSSSL